MAQHFLLTADSRTLSLKQIFRLTDNEAFEMIKSLRWEGGKPVCPHCGHEEKHYWISTRKRWKCSDCHRQFSVTSGTIFAYHKLPIQDYLAAIAIFSNGSKGYSALQLSRDLDVQYKTAFVLAHKIREAIGNFQDDSALDGEVEVDGSYFGGYIKPANKKEDRVDRRKAENQNGKRRCVIAFRKKSEDGEGADRTICHVIDTENQEEITEMAIDAVDPEALIHADQHSGYDALESYFETTRVNHNLQYSDYVTGGCINQCESFFSRMARCHIGQHHHIDPKYLINYATEMAFREDTRRDSNGAIFQNILGRAMKSPVSPEWCGYWQGNHRTDDGMYQSVAVA